MSKSDPVLIDVLTDLSCVLFRCEMAPDGTISYPWISAAITGILGLSPSEMTVSSTGRLNAVHWADRDAHHATLCRSAETLTPAKERFRAISRDGETHWLRGSAHPRREADGRIVWTGAWFDDTASMRAETQFQTVMDHSQDCIITLDAHHGIEWTNAATDTLFGWNLEDLRGRCIFELLAEPCPVGAIPRSGAECSGTHTITCLERGTREVMARRANGTTFPFEMTVSEVRSDGRLSLFVIGRDITRRRSTEQLLEESERRLQSIADNLPGVVFQRVRESDGTYSFTYLSDGIRDILGYEDHEITDNPTLLFDAIDSLDRARLLKNLERSAETLEPTDEDMLITGRDGRQHWLSGQSRPRRRDDLVIWDGLILDVTDEVEERLAAGRAIRDSEERFRLVFASATLGIVVTRPDGTIRQCNPAIARMCGTQSEQMIGDNLFRFVDRWQFPDLDHLVQLGETFTVETSPTMDGLDERHWRLTGTTFRATLGDATVSLLLQIEDITEAVLITAERHQLEVALIEGQKLESLGRLAGGVAHELNNMLGPILMTAEMMARTGSLDERNKERCGRVIEAAKHGRDIVRNVLAYCRKEETALAPIDLVPEFTRCVDLITSILPPTIRVKPTCALTSAVIMGDSARLTQVLLNLANNARDAMDGHGTLALDLSPAEDAFPSAGKAAADFRQVEIRISDTGSGMSDETAARIFDPFFTTKPVGQGTGLGLSVVKGIIDSMGGSIEVESKLSCGTDFRILLPLA
jgi:PAS domain S-box-containing protein